MPTGSLALTRIRQLRVTGDDLLPALILIVLAAMACITPAQNDTWWHLRSGQQMWQTGSLLVAEPFSYTASGAPLNNHWWLSQLLFYAAYSLGGPFLLTLVAGGCAVVAVAGSWRLVRGEWEVRVVLLAWLVIATAPEWAIRPQAISLALLVAMAHLVARGRFHWLPLICVVWANFHALVIFGVGMAGAVAVEALLWSRDNVRRSVGVAAAAVTAPMISPIGWSYWPQVLTTVSMSRDLQLHEYRLPLGAEDLPFWLAAGLLIALTLAQRAALRTWSRGERILLISALGLAVAAATAARNVAFFAVVAAPVLARFCTLARVAPARVRRPVGAAAYALLVVVGVGASGAVLVQWTANRSRLGWEPMSAAAVDAVRRCPDPLFNTLVDGGFLMWALPERRVFVDSRMEAYPLALLQRSRAADLDGEYRELFREYDIGCAVIATGSLLHERLATDASMVMVHTDGARTVFARGGAGRAAAARDGTSPTRAFAER